jgi:hypothetical protein
MSAVDFFYPKIRVTSTYHASFGHNYLDCYSLCPRADECATVFAEAAALKLFPLQVIEMPLTPHMYATNEGKLISPLGIYSLSSPKLKFAKGRD